MHDRICVTQPCVQSERDTTGHEWSGCCMSSNCIAWTSPCMGGLAHIVNNRDTCEKSCWRPCPTPKQMWSPCCRHCHLHFHGLRGEKRVPRCNAPRTINLWDGDGDGQVGCVQWKAGAELSLPMGGGRWGAFIRASNGGAKVVLNLGCFGGLLLTWAACTEQQRSVAAP